MWHWRLAAKNIHDCQAWLKGLLLLMTLVAALLLLLTSSSWFPLFQPESLNLRRTAHPPLSWGRSCGYLFFLVLHPSCPVDSTQDQVEMAGPPHQPIEFPYSSHIVHLPGTGPHLSSHDPPNSRDVRHNAEQSSHNCCCVRGG